MSLSNEELIEQEMIAVAIMEYQKYMDGEDTVTLGSRLHDFQDFVNEESLKDTKVAPGIFGKISSLFSKKDMSNDSNLPPELPSIIDRDTGSIPSPVLLEHPDIESTTTSPPISPDDSSHGTQHGTPHGTQHGTQPGTQPGTPLGTPRGPRGSNVADFSLQNIQKPRLCGSARQERIISPYPLYLVIAPENFGKIFIISYIEDKKIVFIQELEKGAAAFGQDNKKYSDLFKKFISPTEQDKILSIEDAVKLLNEYKNGQYKITGKYFKHSGSNIYSNMPDLTIQYIDAFIKDIGGRVDTPTEPPSAKPEEGDGMGGELFPRGAKTPKY